MRIRKFNENSDIKIEDKIRELFVEFIDYGIEPEIKIFYDKSDTRRTSIIDLAPISINLAGTFDVGSSTIMEMLIDVKNKITNTLNLIESGGGVNMTVYGTEKTYLNIKINFKYN